MKSKPKPLGYYNQKATKLKINSSGKRKDAGSTVSETVVLKVPKKELEKDYPSKARKKNWV